MIIAMGTITPTTRRSEAVSAVPIFDTYLMVDWSATNTPSKPGPDSIWFCLLQRDGDQLKEEALENPLTRHAAFQRLRDALIKLTLEERSVLVGFDFPLGYSQGLAARLGHAGPAWRAIWDEIATLLSDNERNESNRFDVAAQLNRRISNGAFPFWGCPSNRSGPFLAPTHHRQHRSDTLAERRLVEDRMRGPQPGWKLLGVGSVGSQALTGIPVVRRLRDDPALVSHARVWPFETGLRPIEQRTEGARVVLAEIYPSLIANHPEPGEAKDSAQVRAIARHFAALDERGELAAIFAGDPTLSPTQRDAVVAAEGWVLGVTTLVPRNPPPPIASAMGPSFSRRRVRDILPLPPTGERRGEGC